MLIRKEEISRRESPPHSLALPHAIRAIDHNERISEPEEVIPSHYLHSVKNFPMLPQNELLVDLNGDLITSQPLDRYIPSHYEEDLSHEDLTEDDKRLAAALVAVQLVNQQKNQTSSQHILPMTSRMIGMPCESSPQMTQSVVDISPNLAIHSKSTHMDAFVPQLTSLAHFMPQGVTEEVPVVTMTPLPPLKRVLSRSNRYIRPEQVHLESLGLQMESVEIDIGTSDAIKSEMDIFLADASSTQHENVEDDQPDVFDSDYDDTKRNSLLPHKKRIPKKLKTPRKPSVKSLRAQNVAKINQTKKPGYDLQHVDASTVLNQKFECDICHEQFQNQLNFFKHLKYHYEPIAEQVADPNPMEGSLLAERLLGPIANTKERPILMVDSSKIDEAKHLKPWSMAEELPRVVQIESAYTDILHPSTPAATSHHPHHHASQQHQHTDVASQTHYTTVFNEGSIVRKRNVKRPVKLPDQHLTQQLIPPNEVPATSNNSNTNVKSDVVDEFSDTEDMMAGIRVRVNSDDEDSVRSPQNDHGLWYREDDLTATVADIKEFENEGKPLVRLKRETGEVSPRHVKEFMTKDATPKSNRTKTKSKSNRVVKTQWECEKCGRVFRYRNSFAYHMKGHLGLRQHTCTICGKAFLASNALQVHMRLHSGSKPYKCKVCGRDFRQWGDLKYHTVSKHSNQRNFQCEFCGKDFARKYSLTVHCRIHTGERNYKCDFCSKTFRAASYLQNHRRIHTGEKPHECLTCGKLFRVRSDMKRHWLTHNKHPTVFKQPRKVLKRTTTDNNNSENELQIADVQSIVPDDLDSDSGHRLEVDVATTKLEEELADEFGRGGQDQMVAETRGNMPHTSPRHSQNVYLWQVLQNNTT